MEAINQLLLEDTYDTTITQKQVEELKPIQKDFMERYTKNQEPGNQWLVRGLASHLPEKSPEEIQELADSIDETIAIHEEKQKSLAQATANGRSKEDWFAGEVVKATSHMTTQETAQYLKVLDEAIQGANTSLYNTYTTKSGLVSQNPNLDGFLAEQMHAQTFNLNAQAKGSPYRAKVLEPTGAFGKNSVDIVIQDGSGKTVSRYQSKYCKDAEATLQAYNHGDYRGQQLLVPSDQSSGIAKKHTTVLEAPDGVTSNPLSKATAKDLQKEAQSGQWNDQNWNSYKTKDIAKGMGKQIGGAAVVGAVIGVGAHVVEKAWNGEEIDGGEVVEAALVSGVDCGVKAAATGALKVGVEKGILSIIPKGTPVDTLATVAHVAVENVKTLSKVASGEMEPREGMEQMQETTVAAAAGAAGAAIGMALGPAGSVVGGLVAGAIGYMIGSKAGQLVVKGVQKIARGVEHLAKAAWNGIKSCAESAWDSVSCFFSGLFC